MRAGVRDGDELSAGERRTRALEDSAEPARIEDESVIRRRAGEGVATGDDETTVSVPGCTASEDVVVHALPDPEELLGAIREEDPHVRGAGGDAGRRVDAFPPHHDAALVPPHRDQRRVGDLVEGDAVTPQRIQLPGPVEWPGPLPAGLSGSG